MQRGTGHNQERHTTWHAGGLAEPASPFKQSLLFVAKLYTLMRHELIFQRLKLDATSGFSDRQLLSIGTGYPLCRASRSILFLAGENHLSQTNI
jgi:hypothetical protein